MRCNAIRKRIQQWFDVPGAAMPEQVRDHVRTCADCRAFIRKWNAIEVGLVSMRNGSDPVPELSPVFAPALHARLTDLRPPFRLPVPIPSRRVWRTVMVTVAVVLLVLAVRLAVSGMRIGPSTMAALHLNRDSAPRHPREVTPDVNLATHSP